jgi:hypothetical protein
MVCFGCCSIGVQSNMRLGALGYVDRERLSTRLVPSEWCALAGEANGSAILALLGTTGGRARRASD